MALRSSRNELRHWLDKSMVAVPPKSAIGKALGYLPREWPKRIRYLEDGRLPIDNNNTERAIRPFVIGRKGWLFADTPQGATPSANLYSLIETAKANNIEPYHYLRHLFIELPKAESLEAIESLLPMNWQGEQKSAC
jgi:transposase